MNRLFSILCAGAGACLSAGWGVADEAQVSLYVVNRAEEFADMGGACVRYTPELKPGETRELLAIGKGPPGSTLFLIAFDAEGLHRQLPPVLAEQSEESKPTRFPAEESQVRWTYREDGQPAELYVAVFPQGHAQLERIAEYAGWLEDALAEDDAETATLHALAIKNRLSEIVRRQVTHEYRATYGDGLEDLLPTPPSGKAAVTRGGVDPLATDAERKPRSAIAAVRRGLKTLDDEWREDARTIEFGLGAPGILVFPVTQPDAP